MQPQRAHKPRSSGTASPRDIRGGSYAFAALILCVASAAGSGGQAVSYGAFSGKAPKHPALQAFSNSEPIPDVGANPVSLRQWRISSERAEAAVLDSNGEEHGRAAAELLDRLMRGERPPPEPVFVPPGPVAVRASTDRTAAADSLVAKAQELIAANFARPWGASQLAAALGVAPLKLNRHFKAELGRTPGAEILRHRIDHAKELLRGTALPLGQIAARCGFCNASWLCNMFRRETGLSPNAWRTSRHGLG